MDNIYVVQERRATDLAAPTLCKGRFRMEPISRSFTRGKSILVLHSNIHLKVFLHFEAMLVNTSGR